MTCDFVAKLIPLYFYGELTPEDEDRVEEHIHECAGCSREMERHRALAAALDQRKLELPPMLLEDCRADLIAAIEGGAPARESVKGTWGLFLEALGGTFRGLTRFRQPIGALALLAVGFFAAKLTTVHNPSGLQTASLAPSDEVFSTVRSVHPDESGRVQIAMDETRRHVVSGRLDDPNIMRIMLSASHEDNPAVRVESVDLLKSHCNSNSEVRDALLSALSHDPNPGVRQKALEGLKPLAGDAQVRKVLAQVLQNDDNPAVRMQVVDLLLAHPDDSILGVFQNVVQKEDNSYVRLKLEKLLKDMNASVGTF